MDSATLWDIPLARHSDPESSQAAVREIKGSGLRAAQCEAVYRAVAANPGRTSAELAEIMHIDRHIPARRLADLEHQGRVRRGTMRACRVCKTHKGQGRLCVTWYPQTDRRIA